MPLERGVRNIQKRKVPWGFFWVRQALFARDFEVAESPESYAFATLSTAGMCLAQ
jgi:hypothetical protein